MKSLIFLSLFLSLSLSLLSEEVVHQAFSDFKHKFNKSYSAPEHTLRSKIFHTNLEYIHSMNSKSLPFHLGVGPFADLTYSEFSSLHLNPLRSIPQEFFDHIQVLNTSTVPSEVNWVDAGRVSGVEDQGACKCSYIFGAIDAVESARSILFDRLVEDLSEQQILDCDDEVLDNGCEGGEPYVVFDYLVKRDCIATEKMYPYEAKKGDHCKATDLNFDCTDGFVSDWKAVLPNNELQMMEAVSNQPVVAQVYIGPAMQHYAGGVMTGEWCLDGDSTTETNFNTLVVGYGQDQEFSYWIGKNSWGTEWGIGGFYELERNPTNNSTAGSCMIASEVAYPLVL